MLWSSKAPLSGHLCPGDTFGIRNLIISRGYKPHGVRGWNTQTGKEELNFDVDVKHGWFHQRYYPGKATVNYILSCMAGTEFINLDTHHWKTNTWVRGSCITGIMPCNGLLYSTPTSCSCNQDSKLYGFHALAPLKCNLI